MFCTQCGNNNEPGSKHCVQCGAVLQAPIVPVQAVPLQAPQPAYINIPSYMTQSILATILCCPVFFIGIVCIVKANKVNRLIAEHDFEGAMVASSENKTLIWVTFAIGLAVWIIGLAKSCN